MLAVDMDRVTLSVPADPAFHGALRLVVGGIGSRSNLSYEQVNELQLAVEALVAHRSVAGEAVHVEAGIDGSVVTVVVGPFEPDEDTAGRRVVDRLVRRVGVVHRDDGGDWIELETGGGEGQRAS